MTERDESKVGMGEEELLTENEIQGVRDMASCLKAMLVFYSGGGWSDAKNAYWRRLTGSRDVTTRVLRKMAQEALLKSGHGSEAELPK